MPRPTVLTPAQQNRDAGLSRLRSLTWWTAVGAAALTVAATLIAANTNPGRPATQSQSPPAASSSGSDGSGTDNGQGAASAPAPVQQPSINSGPVAVSGGS